MGMDTEQFRLNPANKQKLLNYNIKQTFVRLVCFIDFKLLQHVCLKS